MIFELVVILRSMVSNLSPRPAVGLLSLLLTMGVLAERMVAQELEPSGASEAQAIARRFDVGISPFLEKHCLRCHHTELAEAGVRLDGLNGELEDRHLRLWEGLRSQLEDRAMPPEDEPQPSEAERSRMLEWIDDALLMVRKRETAKNGSIRRLTVAQYENTLRDLLGLEEHLTDILPPDAVSKDGFVNNQQTLQLSPLLLEAYIEVAEKALDRCLVDPTQRPVIQNFRMDLGRKINPEPCPDPLILGALSHLLENDDFRVTQLAPEKPFDFEPLQMRTRFRFIEGYQGNDTVRDWREYDSIYHAVFACMRGTEGYPKGKAYETIPAGLLLRPAIPSAELFEIESTYGPNANFKISLRELPERGNFRVKVKAASYADGLLLEPGTAPAWPDAREVVVVSNLATTQTIEVPESGVYQVDVSLYPEPDPVTEFDGSRLEIDAIGRWSLDGHGRNDAGTQVLEGSLEGEAKFVESPFGQALEVDGKSGSLVVPFDESLSVGSGDFSVAAWIKPAELRQGGIVSLGGYGYTHGWVFDMPDATGVLRLETARPGQQHNGTVQSRPGVIRAGQWQHVAAVVRRGKDQARLYVNGQQVGVGTIEDADLGNPQVDLTIGRIPNANLFVGEIDDVRIYRRVLAPQEIHALLQPGLKLTQPLPTEGPQALELKLGDRHFSGTCHSPAFLAVRLDAGPLPLSARFAGDRAPVVVRLTPMPDTHPVVQQFLAFEKRRPRLGVHVGLRRDCGSTLAAVGPAQTVDSNELREYVFAGAIENYPSPDVEKDNVNYLAGIREIGVRSEFTDGRDRPRLLIHSVEFEGPYYESWPPQTHRNIFFETTADPDSADYAREVIRTFAERAFRRPLTSQEDAILVSAWEDSVRQGLSSQAAVKNALLIVLTSPQFLFLVESSQSPAPEPLNDWELASKLSYFLWNMPPDRELKELAAKGELRSQLEHQTTRLLADPRSTQFTREFVAQWLRLEKFAVVEIDRQRYPALSREVRQQLALEPIRFVEHLLQRNLSVRNLIASDFIVANEVVASYYGLGTRTERGFEFEPILHGDQQLGGVLTQAAILAGLSDGRESNPVKRGAWFARAIIAEPPADPPPNVPALPEDEGAELTLREKLERHRNQKGCVKCHEGIDPWGIPFEYFDAAGRFKTGVDVDARSLLPDDTEVASVNELKAYLIERRMDQVAFSFLKHLAIYAAGRGLTYNEIEFLKEKGLELKPLGYPMQDMVRLVIQSEIFLEK